MLKKENKNNEDKNFAHAVINWYPGHMAKTKKQILEDLKLIDIVIEVLDARVPISSGNPDVREYSKNKKKIVILNKADLADDNTTKMWVEHYKKLGVPAIKIEANTGKGLSEVISTIKAEGKEIIEKFAQKGRIGRTIKVMILGIPNVGKSTLINSLAKRQVAKVENRPGVTVTKQWIKVDNEIELMDTPGMLWPKLNDEGVAIHLGFINTIGSHAIDNEELAYYLLKYLCENYKVRVEQRYDIKIDDSTLSDEIVYDDAGNALNGIIGVREEIAKKRGAIISGGRIDERKVSDIIINDFQTGKLGKISIEKP